MKATLVILARYVHLSVRNATNDKPLSDWSSGGTDDCMTSLHYAPDSRRTSFLRFSKIISLFYCVHLVILGWFILSDIS